MKHIGLMFCLSAFACTASGAILDLSGVSDPTCVENPAAGVYCAANNNFHFTVSNGGGGFFQIINAETFPITELDINIPYFDGGCSPLGGTPILPTLIIDSSFSSQFGSGGVTTHATATCDGSVRDQANYALMVDFFPGIPTGFQFNINLNNDGSSNISGIGGWTPGVTTTNGDSTAPEPGTLAGSIAGLALVYFLTKRSLRRA